MNIAEESWKYKEMFVYMMQGTQYWMGRQGRKEKEESAKSAFSHKIQLTLEDALAMTGEWRALAMLFLADIKPEQDRYRWGEACFHAGMAYLNRLVEPFLLEPEGIAAGYLIRAKKLGFAEAGDELYTITRAWTPWGYHCAQLHGMFPREVRRQVTLAYMAMRRCGLPREMARLVAAFVATR